MEKRLLSLLVACLACVLLSGCASWSNWYSQTPVGIRHTRMMVDSEQEYSYYVDPVHSPREPSRGTLSDWLARHFVPSP